MLRSLQISNYALIRSLDITFEEGLTVITGETGAGKSILMGALALLLGNRADTEVLYDKQKKCVVEAQFDLQGLALEPFFEDNDLDYLDLTTIRREINEHSRSRAFVNDTPVNLNVLKDLSSRLIDIHSQHQSLLLGDPLFRLRMLDQYAQNADLRTQYHQTLGAWRQAEQQYRALQQQCAEQALQQEFRQYTVQELEKAQLQSGEQEELEQQVRILSNAEDIKSRLYRASYTLSEQEQYAVIQLLKSVQQELDALSDIGPDFQELQQRLHAASVEVEDIAYDISLKESGVEVNPHELERLNERLDQLNTLQHKYQVEDVDGLLALKERLESELANYGDHQEQLRQLDQSRQQLYGQLMKLARALSQTREKVIPTLRKEMLSRLVTLGMPHSAFEIELTQSDAPSAEGIDQVTFLFSANKGVPVTDMAKVASGGEMSRLMLSLKSIITDSVVLPTIIFDEIDTGISGETALKVASVMSELSRRHQVIAITHLPQIAASGRQHFLVYKETQGADTVTNIRTLDEAEREHAIAVMLSGEQITPSATATARELIHSLRQSKS
ncbi:MAG: DNA repair protein RecN [Bacteroidales bacterium]|nr:DNA repair protein RecN [Bacteroidales bacterium]